MRHYWSTLGIIMGVLLVVFGLIGWAMGTEFSNPVTHPILYPYGQFVLVAGPAVAVIGAALFAASLYFYRRKERPLPQAIPVQELASSIRKSRQRDEEEGS